MSRELKFNYCHGNADLPWRANGPSAIIMSDQPRTRDRESPPDRYRDYANDVLVSPEWLSRRLDDVRSDDPSLRLVEVDVDPDFYDHEHVPGAIGFDWNSQLRHRTRHDIPSPEAFEELLGSHGIGDDSTVVVYGDNSNWFAAHFYWQLTYYGHQDVYLLDGGREHWLESGRETTPEVPEFTPTTFTTSGPYEHVRARREEVRRAIDDGTVLLDVRMVEEYDGTIVSPPGITETARRGGHIPGAVNVLWSENLGEDRRFKPREELEAVYRDHGVTGENAVVAYCRIGERSSLSWFVLSELLGYESVKNYDGSWTEWGNMVGAPVAVGADPWGGATDAASATDTDVDADPLDAD